MKLVIVEDDLMVAAINREFALRTTNLSIVATFYNGAEALDFLSKNRIDLLLLDIYMSGYTGLELLKELRRRGSMTDAIIISAANDVEQVEEAFHLGIVDYLIKPFTYDRFREAVQKFLLRYSLKAKGKYTQSDIDKLTNAQPDSCDYGIYQKGIQKQTLDKIVEYLVNEGRREYMTSERLSELTGFSKMTVRRYMNYLIEQKDVVSRVNYSTGGRPSIEYMLT